MRHEKVFWFFRCTHCGFWYYSEKRLTSPKKCIKCNKSFLFEHSKKLKRKLTTQEAIAYIQKLKEPDIRELIQFITIPEDNI